MIEVDMRKVAKLKAVWKLDQSKDIETSLEKLPGTLPF
jgi:hypothetical protein